MTIQIVILITYSIFFILEVQHDYILSLIRKFLIHANNQIPPVLSDDDERKLNADWHKWDFTSHALLALLVAWLAFYHSGRWQELLYPIQIACLRMLILNIGLALKWEMKNKFYLGSGKIDTFLKNTFGNWWPIPIFIMLLGAIAINIFT